METTNIVDFARRDGMTDALTELLKTGARALIASAVETELASYMAQFSELRTEAGHAAVVLNGHHPARPFQTGIGPVRAHSQGPLKGLPEPRRHAAHDVQARTMR